MSDGAWQCFLQDSVTEYNAANGTDFDPYDEFISFCEEKHKRERESLKVGSIIRAWKPFSTVTEGMAGVIYEVYKRGGKPEESKGVSIIFESSFYDGFSPDDLDVYRIISTGLVDEKIEQYQFTNVIDLNNDYHAGKFAGAFAKAAEAMTDE